MVAPAPVAPAAALARLPRPFIVAVITDRTPEAAVSSMRAAALDGAHAFEVNLPLYPDAAPAALAPVFAATGRPAYTTCRRAAFMPVYGIAPADLPSWTDEERIDRQLAMLGAGSCAIDIEMDTFDPAPPPDAAASREPGPPGELTRDPAAVRRQADAARAARAAGAEVFFSCHTGRPQTAESLIEIARLALERGADLLKIVTPCAVPAHLYAVLEASRRLAGRLPIPFTINGSGPAGDISRLI
ncbi:MAG: type I 3-dehydroquinate dehydratase, partial [Chloroflexota bacterium]